MTLHKRLHLETLLSQIDAFSDEPNYFSFILQGSCSPNIGGNTSLNAYVGPEAIDHVPSVMLRRSGDDKIYGFQKEIRLIEDVMLFGKKGGVIEELAIDGGFASFNCVQQAALQFIDFYMRNTDHDEKEILSWFAGKGGRLYDGRGTLCEALSESMQNAGIHGNAFEIDRPGFDTNEWEEAPVEVFSYFGRKGVVYIVRDEGKSDFDIDRMYREVVESGQRYSTAADARIIQRGKGTTVLHANDRINAAYSKLPDGKTELIIQYLF